MLKSFSTSLNSAKLREPNFLVRLALGILLASNLVAAAFAFHLFGDSPEDLNARLTGAVNQRVIEQQKLERSRALAGNISKGKEEGNKFLAADMTSRRRTWSTIIGELTTAAKESGMKMQEASIAPIEPIEGTEDLSMDSLTVSFEGGYAQLVKLINFLDRSPRFFILESLTVTPKPQGDVLSVSLKVNTFIREDREAI
jgi:hypothetical protein